MSGLLTRPEPQLRSENVIPPDTGITQSAFFAMNLSLAVGLFMLAIKAYAYWVTGSAAILSDAAESVVHNIAVLFAAYSLRLSMKPADQMHPYGHDRISFFSAGFEGMMIVLAAVYIMFEAIRKWLSGLRIEQIDVGIEIVTLAMLVNGALGWYLIHRGRKYHLIVLEANGKHVLTDSWTSLGVIVGLLLTKWTGWLPFDPLLAIAVALNILFSGTTLLRRSIGGLMDESDPAVHAELTRILDEGAAEFGLRYHRLRHRNAGNKLLVEFHLLFDDHVTIAQAHEEATMIENAIRQAFPYPTEVLSHLEPAEAHDSAHERVKSS